MEAKTIEISALLCAGLNKLDIAHQLKVSWRTMHRVADYLKNKKTLKKLTSFRQTPSYQLENGQKDLPKQFHPQNGETDKKEENFCCNNVKNCQE